MIPPACFFVPVSALFDMSAGIVIYFVRFISIIAAVILYMVLHELVHGIAMKHYGSETVRYGFTGLYAYAGCSEYFSKKSYIVIALAPIVVWGIVLAVICAAVPREWFWVAYFVQVCNISGAAGDLYVTTKFEKMPKDILISDSSVDMKVFSAE